MATFKALSHHFPGGTEGSNENFSQDSRPKLRALKPGLANPSRRANHVWFKGYLTALLQSPMLGHRVV